MPAVLLVQGLELNVSLADWEPVRLGTMARGFSGQPRSTVRATKRDHHFLGDVAGVPLATAELYRLLIEGAGHSWSFDDASNLLPSSRGLLPSSSGAVGDVAGKYGGGAEFTDGEADTVWPVDFDVTNSTLMYWVKESGTWVHYLVRYEGSPLPTSVWRNAIQTNVDPAWFFYDTGNTLLGAPSQSGTFQADDLVALPYQVPDAWVQDFISWRADHGWDPLPYVAASGAAFPNGVVKALGQAGAAHRVPSWSGGTFDVAEVLDFTLMED